MAGEKVLVIDDKKDTIQLITECVLRPHGYYYMFANTGEEGFRLALEKKPDLIITDLRASKMSGLEILEALQAEGRDIPVILMSLYGSEEVAVRAFRLGAKDYLIKPFKVEEMLEAIDRVLAEKRLSKAMGGVDQQLDQRVKELNILYGVGKSVTSLLDLEKVLNSIVEAAVFVTGAEEGSLMLVDQDTGELYLRAARNLGEKFTRGFRLKVEHSIAGLVVKTGEPILESTQDEKTLKVKTDYLVKSLVNVPLKAKDEVIGVLAVNNKLSPRPFTDNDVYLLSALADYAAIAIENARLYQDIGDKAVQLDTLLEIVQSITSQLDLEAVLQMIVDSAVTKLGSDVATLYLYDPIRDEFRSPVTAGHIDHPEEMIPPTKDSVVYRMLRQEGLYLAHDAEHDKVMARGFIRREKVKSSAGFSLRVGGEPVGIMFVNYRKPHRFTEGEKNVLTLFAQSATIAIQNAQLYNAVTSSAAELEQKVQERTQELQTAYEELGTLYHVGKSVTSLLDLKKVLNRIVEAAVSVTGAEEGFLLLVDRDTGDLYLRAARGLSDKSARGFTLKIVEDNIAGQVVKTGEPILRSTEDDEETLKVKTGLFAKSLVSVPLKAKDRVIGVLTVDNQTSSRPFTDNDAVLLSALADYAAIAIENAQLFKDVEERTQDLQTAYEALQKAQEQMLAAERWAILGKAAANLAHRINNTAGLIPVVTQDLKELLADVALKEERRQEIDADLQRIERNTRFTLQMADALFKPFETLPTEECDVNTLLEKSISVANVPEDVKLKTKHADELPKVVVSRRLADVFVELITNAVKAMPGGGELEIGSRMGREEWVEVWFSDTGHGIPPESQGKIFDLFFTTSKDSLGFGLWWVKTFLLQQRATIDVESEVGKGTTFTVRLPVKGLQAAVASP